MMNHRVRRRPWRWGWALAGALVLLLQQPHARASKNYQLFRFDTSLFFAYAHGTKNYGGGIFLEPKFAVLDQLVVGAHVGVGIFGGGSIDAGTGKMGMSVGAVVPFLAKVEYYILHSPIRPFIGFGMGIYDIASQSISAGPGVTGIDQRAGVHFGMAPQVGIELGFFRLSVTYHAIIGAAMEVRQTVSVGGSPSAFDVSQNYLTFDIGFRAWGKRRRPPPPPPPTYGPPPGAPMPPPGPAPAPAPGPAPAPPPQPTPAPPTP